MLDNPAYQSMPERKRGRKFEWLLGKCRENGLLDRLAELVDWNDPELRHELLVNSHHEEQARLLCAMTAVCVWQGKYVAMGEPHGGYFFLPPWVLWCDWAKAALNVTRSELEPVLDIWIDGKCYGSDDRLP